MRNVFVIVLALWSGVAMAQLGSGVSKAVYAIDKQIQTNKDSTQSAQIGGNTVTAANALSMATGTGIVTYTPVRGDAELIGSNSFSTGSYYTLGLYDAIPSATLFNTIQVGLSTTSACVVRVYRSTFFNSNPSNLTLIEEKQYAAGAFNTNTASVATISLSNTYTIAANDKIYVILYVASGSLPRISYFASQSGANDRHGFLILNSSSSPWSQAISVSSSGFFQTGIKLINTGAIGQLQNRVTSLESTNPVTLAIAPKLYIPAGKELAIYSENLHKYWYPYRDKTEITVTGGKTTGRSAKITPSSATTIAGGVTVGNDLFSVASTKSFTVIASDAANTNAVKVLNLGDSYTFMSTYTNALAATSNVTFLGIRKATNSTPANTLCEGRGGWAVTGTSGYLTANTNRYNPFMQPGGSYYYLGNTNHWITAINSPSDYDSGSMITSATALFNGTTGYPSSPQINWVIYDNAQAGSFVWNGAAWVSITAATLNFSFNFAKYRTLWGIATPDIVHILLGTNDFSVSTEATFSSSYPVYKAGIDAMIASIRADSPNAKILLGIPVSSGKQGEFGTYTTERRKRAYWLLANSLITDYAGQEASKLYLVDYHSCVDRQYGYATTAEKPYGYYAGSWTENYLSDFTHLDQATGFKQMADLYWGIIQSLR